MNKIGYKNVELKRQQKYKSLKKITVVSKSLVFGINLKEIL